MFGAEYANVQPHSGARPMQAVFLACLTPGDRVLGFNLALWRAPFARLSGQLFRGKCTKHTFME
nr:hypothetical protein [Haliscomenobacter sp.]